MDNVTLQHITADRTTLNGMICPKRGRGAVVEYAREGLVVLLRIEQQNAAILAALLALAPAAKPAPAPKAKAKPKPPTTIKTPRKPRRR